MEPQPLDDPAGRTGWSRRGFLRTGLLGGAVTLAIAACGGAKEAAQAVSSTSGNSSASTTTATSASSMASSTAAASSTSATAGATTSAGAASTSTVASAAATTTAGPTTTATAAAARAVADNQELVVDFSYVAGGGGRIHNPYVAVWIEDQSGRSLRTIYLSVQAGKGSRWIPDLKRWYRADQARLGGGGGDLISTISGATRIPGDVSVAWDGLDDAGAPVPAGSYVLFVEAARERGPYQIVSQELALAGQPLSASPAPEGDLQNVVIQLSPRR